MRQRFYQFLPMALFWMVSSIQAEEDKAKKVSFYNEIRPIFQAMSRTVKSRGNTGCFNGFCFAHGQVV